MIQGGAKTGKSVAREPLRWSGALVGAVVMGLALALLPATAPAAVTVRSTVPSSNYAVIATIPVAKPEGVAVSADDTVFVTVDASVAGDDSIVMIPPGSLAVDDTITVGQNPSGLAVSIDDTVYVGNQNSGTLSVVSGTALLRSVLLYPASASNIDPQGVAVDLLDDTVYVALRVPARLSALRGQNLDDSLTVPVGSNPSGVAVNQLDDTVYVANNGANSLSVINGRSLDDSETITLGISTQPRGVAVNQTDDTVYVATYGTGALSVIAGTDTSNRQVVPLGNGPLQVAVDDSSPNDTVYVTRHVPGSNGRLSIINGRHLDDSVSVTVGTFPLGVAVRSDGTAYVANNLSNSLSVIGLVTPTLVTTSGSEGSQVTVTLSVPGGYASDAATVAAISFGGVLGTSRVRTGTNEWQVTAPAGSGTVPVRVTFNGGLSAEAGNFTYGASPGPDPGPEPDPVYPPTAPTSAAATAGNGSATVSWVAPTSPGTYPVTHYQATSSPTGGTCLVAAPTTSCEVSGLTNGTTYTFAVRALNGAGWGDFSSASNPVRPSGATPAPSPVPVPPLEPGQSQLVVDGKVTPVQVDPNARADGLTITGDDFSMNLKGLGRDGQPLNLSPDGALILNEDRQVDTSGSGFQAASEVDLYIDPPTLVTTSGRSTRAAEATYVGTLITDGNGSFAGRPTLPAGISAGRHILQAVGLTKSGQPRAMSLGVLVTPDISITLIKGPRTKDGRHDRIRATGTTTEVPAGTKLVPYVQLRGQGEFTKGKATLVVQADGSFTWTRLVLRSKSLTAFVAWEDIASNREVWGRVR